MTHIYRLERPDDLDRMDWLANPWNILTTDQLYAELGYYTSLIDNCPTVKERELYVECLHQVVQELELRQSKYNWN